MFTNDQGFCQCNNGFHLVEGLGCVDCQYLIPGCNSCSDVAWNSGIVLDSDRVFGGAKTGSVTCDSCFDDARFVEIDIDMVHAASYDIYEFDEFDYSSLEDWVVTTGKVKCESCQTRFDGCGQCGTYGEECTKCYPTHLLQIEDTETNDYPCMRCDKIVRPNCLTCYNSKECKTTKPSMLL